MNRVDKSSISLNKTDVLAFSCIRNEVDRLPYFLTYHRGIGVNHFFIVDNGSRDGSLEYLLSQCDVYVFQTSQSYADSNFGMDWINQLLTSYGIGHWTLTVDADELFIYPYSEHLSLDLLGEYLDSINADAIKSFLLDMYSNKPIEETKYEAGEPFTKVCPYFDINSYEFEKGLLFKKKNSIPIRGGVRHRIFWEGYVRDKPSPVLKKIPFVKWKNGYYYKISTHQIDKITLGNITGVLQHFKLFEDFFNYSRTESKRKEHWDDASQYKSYWEVLRNNHELNPFYEQSVKFEDSKQLINLGLMYSSKKFKQFAESKT